MPHTQTVHLCGEASSLTLGLIERLLRTEVHIVLEDDLHERVCGAYATDLEYRQAPVSCSSDVALASGHRVFLLGLGPLAGSAKARSRFDVDGSELILVTPQGVDVPAAMDWVDAHVTVHDMLPMRTDSIWMPTTLTSWADGMSVGNFAPPEGDEHHWWVSEIDVADALVRLSLSAQPFPKSCKMSGRRSWPVKQTHEEFQLLYQRTMAGKTGVFGVQELTAAPTPHIELQSLMVTDATPMSISVNRQDRPDLSPVHDALHAADGDGWRPLVPVRTALMHCLVGLLGA